MSITPFFDLTPFPCHRDVCCFQIIFSLCLGASTFLIAWWLEPTTLRLKVEDVCYPINFFLSISNYLIFYFLFFRNLILHTFYLLYLFIFFYINKKDSWYRMFFNSILFFRYHILKINLFLQMVYQISCSQSVFLQNTITPYDIISYTDKISYIISFFSKRKSLVSTL